MSTTNQEKPKYSVTIIWVHFKTPELLLRSVSAVVDDCTQHSINCQLLVINNGGTIDNLSMPTEHVEIIDLPQNPGYAAAINEGVARALAPKIIVLNPDVIVQPELVVRILKRCSNQDIVAPVLFLDDMMLFKLPRNERYGLSDQVLRHLTGIYPTLRSYVRSRWRKRSQISDTDQYYFNLNGACLGFSRQAWETIGPWDESFFLYFEETDWLIRAKQHSIRGQVVSEAVAIHYVSQSPLKPEQQAAVFQQSLRHFNRKHLNRIERMVLRFVERGASAKSARSTPQPLQKVTTDKKPALKEMLNPGQMLEISNRSEGFPAAVCEMCSWEIIDNVLIYLRTNPVTNCHICLLDRDKNELIPPTPLDQFAY